MAAASLIRERSAQVSIETVPESDTMSIIQGPWPSSVVLVAIERTSPSATSASRSSCSIWIAGELPRPADERAVLPWRWDSDQVRRRIGTGPDILDVPGAETRGRRVEGAGRLPFVHQDLARGPAHGLAPAIPVLPQHGLDTGIDLARRCGTDVVPDPATGLGSPPQESPSEIGAGGDDLGRQGILVPAERDLSNPLQIGVERRHLDHGHAIRFCRDPERPRVAPTPHLQICAVRRRDFDHCSLRSGSHRRRRHEEYERKDGKCPASDHALSILAPSDRSRSGNSS